MFSLCGDGIVKEKQTEKNVSDAKNYKREMNYDDDNGKRRSIYSSASFRHAI